jgi:hypothetical protein
MNVYGSRVRVSWVSSTLIAVMLSVACTSEQVPAKDAETAPYFEFAPPVGLVFRHEMRHLEEFTVPAESFREALEWRILWEVRVDEEGDYYRYHRRLLELGLTVNDQPVLIGNEMAAQNAEIVQMMLRSGRARDVTGTEQLTEAIASLAPEAQQTAVAKQFSPTNLRELLLERAVDVFDDVVGKPTRVGSSWPARESAGLLHRKGVRVDSALACGDTVCRKLVRSYDIDQQMLGDVARRRVARFSAQQQWDPDALQVVETNVVAEDSFVVEPNTCLFHDALSTQQGRVLLEGPAGRRAELLLTSRDTSHAEYPSAK